MYNSFYEVSLFLSTGEYIFIQGSMRNITHSVNENTFYGGTCFLTFRLHNHQINMLIFYSRMTMWVSILLLITIPLPSQGSRKGKHATYYESPI